MEHKMRRRIDNTNNALVSQKIRLIQLEWNQAGLRMQLDGFSESVAKFARDIVSAVTSVKKVADKANTLAIYATIVGLGAFAYAVADGIQHDALDAQFEQSKEHLLDEIGSLRGRTKICEVTISDLRKEIEELKKEVHGDGKDANTEN